MKTWDIFCRVIDNYGDIGVCWRLARQLVDEHGLDVRLWVDEIAALQQIWPEARRVDSQELAGVKVCIWAEDFRVDRVAEVVIEAFACHLPEAYEKAILQVKPAPLWINLEYLSAESWVEGCHQLSSINPQNGLKKTFYFPGFNAKTGGLLRECGLLERRHSFAEGNGREHFLSRLGLAPGSEHSLLISLFSYENAAIESLLQAWSQSPVAVVCLVPEGKALLSVNRFLAEPLAVGKGCTLGSLTLQTIPFLTQSDYDLLLWSCDINFVRGEDSFVRAQWAAKPFIWHIYPQDDQAHMVKLDAFLDKYTALMPPELAELVRRLWQAWNRGEDTADPWQKLMAHHLDWREHNQIWSDNLGAAPDLATNLVHFCQKLL
ncbi:MAG TPA: elongation factor P maturation arginine rhamnosyltransferase EarP [Cellvibrio sp.]|nr:elongation factor P maturation arginine rhamnosyltransferase EarP [Cellvibrio sp.]